MKLRNGKIYGADGKFHTGDIRIENGVFAEVRLTGTETASAGGEESVDATGLYLLPGLTDIHFHGCVEHDFCEGTIEAIQKIAEYEESVGVTQICPATMTFSEEILTGVLRAAREFPNERGARLVGVNMEGPFISQAKKGAQNPKYIQAPDADMFERLQEASGGLVKLVDIAPEEPGAEEFIRREKDKVVISLAHTDADYDTALAALTAGARHMTHLYNAMNPIHHRKPGPILAAADTDFTEVELICDGIHSHPAVVRNTFRMFGEDRIIFISDTMEATGMPDGEYELGGQPVIKKGNRATLKDGTIAGSATNLMDCMRTAVKEMRIPLEAAVKCAAVNPAKSIGIYDIYGSIEAGKAASLVALDEALALRMVFNRGVRVCFP